MLTVLKNIRSTNVLWQVEDDIRWKTAFGGRRPSRQDAEIWYVECSHKYKINQGVMVGGRRPLVEDDLWWKTTFGGRRPSVEDNLRWKMTFSGR